MPVPARRSVDWPVSPASEVPAPKMLASTASGELGSLLSGFDRLLGADDADTAARRAIEVARAQVGLDRVGNFLLDETAGQALGTWGTDVHGELVDEHHAMFELGSSVLAVFRRAESGGQPFTIYDNCPIVVYGEGVTKSSVMGGLLAPRFGRPAVGSASCRTTRTSAAPSWTKPCKRARHLSARGARAYSAGPGKCGKFATEYRLCRRSRGRINGVDLPAERLRPTDEG